MGHGNLSYTVIKTYNSITVSQNVSSNGTYKCEISDGYSKIETTTIIRFRLPLSGKCTHFMLYMQKIIYYMYESHVY